MGDKITKVKDLIEMLKQFEPEAQVMVSNDEELNMIHWGFEVAMLDDPKNGDEDKFVVIYPLSGNDIAYPAVGKLEI